MRGDRPDRGPHLLELGARRFQEVDVLQLGLDVGDCRDVELGADVGADQPFQFVDSGADQRRVEVRVGDADAAHQAGDVCGEEHALHVVALGAEHAREAGVLVDQGGGERGEVGALGERGGEVGLAQCRGVGGVAVAVGADESGGEVAVERPLERGVVAGLLDERGAQRGVQLGASGDVDLGRGPGGVDDLGQRHVDAGGLQGASERDGAIGQRAVCSLSGCRHVPDRGTVSEGSPPDKSMGARSRGSM